MYISYKLSVSASAADLWTTLGVAGDKNRHLNVTVVLKQRLTLQASRILTLREG